MTPREAISRRKSGVSRRRSLRRLFALGLVAAAAVAARADFRDFFAPEHCAAIALSPDGEHVAYFRFDAGPFPRLVIVGVGSDGLARSIALPPSTTDAAHRAWLLATDQAPVLLPLREERFAPRIAWLDAQRLIVTTGADELFFCDTAGEIRKLADPNTFAGAARVRPFHPVAGAPPPSDPSAFEGTAQTRPVPRSCRFIPAESDPDRVLVEAQGSVVLQQNGAIPDPTALFSLSLSTGQATELGESGTRGFFFYDQQGRARILDANPAGPRASYTLSSGDFFHSILSQALDASGAVAAPAAFIVDAGNYLGHRAYPLGFGFKPAILYYASNVGRDKYGIYGYDLEARHPTGEVFEDPDFDLADPAGIAGSGQLVFDRSRRELAGVRRWGGPPKTFWQDAEIAGMQAALERKFPHRTVVIEGWNDSRTRFLLRAEAEGDAGRYFLYDRSSRLPFEIARRLTAAGRNDDGAHAFAFTSPAGVRLTGRFIRPAAPKINPPPLVVICRGSPWEPSSFGFDRQAEGLASMGFVVLAVHYRGSTGEGAAFREALRTDPILAPLDDLRAAIAWLRPVCPFDPTRVALLGEDYGGYLAYRAVRLYPHEFRCALCIDAPLAAWRWTNPDWRPRTLVRAEWDFNDSGVQTTHVLPFGAHADAIASEQEQDYKSGSWLMKDPALPDPLPSPLAVNRSPAGDLLAAVRRDFLAKDTAEAKAGSAAEEAKSIRVPLLIIERASAGDDLEAARQVRNAMVANGVPAALWQTPRNSVNRDEGNLAKAGEFLNLTFYSFGVKIGSLRVIEQTP